MNYKKHTLLLVSAVVLLSAGIAGVAMAQSVLFDKDIDLQGTKKILNANAISIGATSAGTALDIGGGSAYINTNATYQLFTSSDKIIQLRGTTQAVLSLISDVNTQDGILGGIYFGRTVGQSDAWINLMGIRAIQAGAASTVSHADLAIHNQYYGEVVRFKYDGKVGIGTTNPSSRLTVSPVSSISADMLSGRIQNLASPVNTADAATKNYVDTVAAGGTLWTLGATELNIYTTNSRGVGIGTATPLHKLDIIGSYYSRTVVKGTCSGTVAIDWTEGNTQHCVLGSTPVTFTFSGAQSGGNYKLILKQDGTGSRTVSWPATIRWGSGSAPYLTPTPLKTDYVGFIYNGIDGYYDSVAFNANF